MIEFTKYPEGNVWATGISSVTISTDSTSKVTVSVYRGASASGTLVFSNSYSAAGSTVLITGMSGIIGLDMQSNKLQLSAYTITAVVGDESDTKTFTVVYCDREIPYTVDKWATCRFLTPAEMLRIPYTGSVSLYSLCTKDETSFSVVAVGKKADGTITQSTINGSLILKTTDSLQLAVLPTITPRWISVELSSISTDPIVALMSFVIIHGARTLQTFIVDAPAASVTFKYRNPFNVQETITLPGITKKTLDLTRSTANMLGTTTQYDISGYRTYELTTAPMTEADAMVAEYLITSWDVTDSVGRPVLITSTDYSFDTDRFGTKTLTISWRYASQRVIDESVVSTATGIFSDPFSYQYS